MSDPLKKAHSHQFFNILAAEESGLFRPRGDMIKSTGERMVLGDAHLVSLFDNIRLELLQMSQIVVRNEFPTPDQFPGSERFEQVSWPISEFMKIDHVRPAVP